LGHFPYYVELLDNLAEKLGSVPCFSPQDKGLIIVDKTEVKRLRDLRRRMGRFNPVPNLGGPGYRPIPVTTIVEDAVHRDSKHSLFIQLVDVNAYLLMQKYAPYKYVKKQGGKNYLDRLTPVLCTVASRTNPLRIVERWGRTKEKGSCEPGRSYRRDWLGFRPSLNIALTA